MSTEPEVRPTPEHAVGQLWCLPQHSHKEMDSVLATDMAALLRSREAELEAEVTSAKMSATTWWAKYKTEQEILVRRSEAAEADRDTALGMVAALVEALEGLKQRDLAMGPCFCEIYAGEADHDTGCLLARLALTNQSRAAAEFEGRIRESERERCARTAEANENLDWAGGATGSAVGTARAIAAAIRKGAQEKPE